MPFGGRQWSPLESSGAYERLGSRLERFTPLGALGYTTPPPAEPSGGGVTNYGRAVLIPLDSIDVVAGIGSPDGLARVARYAAALAAGERFPPIVVTLDVDGRRIVSDGAHRYAAARLLGWREIEAVIA